MTTNSWAARQAHKQALRELEVARRHVKDMLLEILACFPLTGTLARTSLLEDCTYYAWNYLYATREVAWETGPGVQVVRPVSDTGAVSDDGAMVLFYDTGLDQYLLFDATRRV